MNRVVMLLVVTLLFVSVAAAQPVTDGLVAYYSFDGDTGDATVYGASPAADRHGLADNAYAFDGNDYMATPLQIETTTGTVAAWVYVDSYQTGFNQLNLILGQFDNLQLGLGDSSLDADGHWVFRLRDDSGVYKTAVGPLVTTGTWVHVTGLWDGAAVVILLNGEVASAQHAGPGGEALGPLMIGRHSHAYSQNFWFGMIDEVVIYNRALTENEIRMLAGVPTANESRTWGDIKAVYR